MVVAELWKELKDSKFLPEAFELAFGGQEGLAAIDVGTERMGAVLRGFVDRVDVWQENGQNYFRIVDYKTGGEPKNPANVASLFIPDKNRSGYVFQTFLYASIMNRKTPGKVAPSLLYINRASSEEYSPVVCLQEPYKSKIPVLDFSLYEDEFREELKKLLEELFHPEVSFTQTEVEEKCAFCDFKAFCKK